MSKIIYLFTSVSQYVSRHIYLSILALQDNHTYFPLPFHRTSIVIDISIDFCPLINFVFLLVSYIFAVQFSNSCREQRSIGRLLLELVRSGKHLFSLFKEFKENVQSLIHFFNLITFYLFQQIIMNVPFLEIIVLIVWLILQY